MVISGLYLKNYYYDLRCDLRNHIEALKFYFLDIDTISEKVINSITKINCLKSLIVR